MKNALLYIGRQYGIFTILEFQYIKRFKNGRGVYIYLVECGVCSKRSIVNLNSIRSRPSKNCKWCRGLLHTTHGKSNSGLYCSWQHMIQRCDNSNATGYNQYGGRGIKYTNRWSRFEDFQKDMGGTWKKSLTLDRIDNNKGYCKANCRWATRLEQIQNRTNTIFLTHKERTQTLSQWAKEYNIPYKTLYMRYYRNSRTIL